MPVHELSEVDVIAMSIVDKAANRKRFYLRKQEANEHLVTLPSSHRLLKADDWSTVYCVVAEPGAEEDPGVGSPGEQTLDVWASDDEIRRAAHRFMRNGGLVNKMHETLDPYGQVVENFIAQADFAINGEVIKSGSWVVGIEPSTEGRLMIENGQFTGVSIQGSGIRRLSKDSGSQGPKAKKCPSCQGTVAHDKKTCQNCGYSFNVSKSDEELAKAMTHEPTVPPGGPGLFGIKGAQLPAYIQHVFNDLVKKGHPRTGRTYALAIGIVKNWAAGHDGHGNPVSKQTQAKAIAAIAEWERLKARARADNVKKAETHDDAKVREEAVQDDDAPITKSWLRRAFGLGASDLPDPEEIPVSETTTEQVTKADFDSFKEDQIQKASALESAVTGLVGTVNGLIERLDKKPEEEEVTPEEQVAKAVEGLDKLQESVDSMRSDIEKLASGSSTQPERVTVEKTNDHPLAGLLD